MRRKDREVKDFEKIIEILDECEILRLGLADGEYPYIVPVNFAYEVTNGKLFLYIHGAQAGRKFELLSKNKVCSFEADVPLKMECIAQKGDVTMRYKSVMGKADVEFLESEERQKAIDGVIMARYAETRNFKYNRNAVLHTAVAKLTVTELSGKANLPGGEADL